MVTGGTGYVGTALVPVLARKYPVRVYCSEAFGNAIKGTQNVEFVKGDIRDAIAVHDAIKGCTDVIHLAGIVTDELAAMNPELASKVNVDGMHVLLKSAANSGVQRFIYASSSGVYGSQRDGAVADEETETKPETAYMQTKLDGEKALWEYADRMTCTAVRSATCCGPAPRMRLDTIVNVFCKQAYFDGCIQVHGGDQWRTNVHVSDAADFYALMLAASPNMIHREVWNLTSGNLRAIDIACMIARSRICSINVDKTKTDTRHYKLSALKAFKKLGWKPSFTVLNAIQDNFAFFDKGNIKEPNSDLYFNTRRMAAIMKEGI